MRGDVGNGSEAVRSGDGDEVPAPGFRSGRGDDGPFISSAHGGEHAAGF